MLSSYIKLALRHLAKHRLYAFINIAGLALGLCIFLFSTLLVSYEYNHDSMFSKRDRIYLVGSVIAPTAGENILEMPNVRTAYGPIFDVEIEEAQQVARALFKERLLTVNNDHYYQGIRFVDSGFTRIFDFQYIYGDPTAIDDPRGLIITASTAQKIFGSQDVLGEVISLEHKYDMRIAAVIEDLPAGNSFESSLMPNFGLTAIASIEALISIDDFKMEGEWETFNPEDMTFVLLPENRDGIWLQDQVNAVLKRHAPAKEFEQVSALKVRPLIELNIMVWDSLGMPVLESVELLGLLILIIACVNYTNLATAQSFSRTREVGLRKTFGAGRAQLMAQFLVESLTISSFAMILALASIELLVPAYNGWTGREVTLNYISILPWLILTTIAVGLLAGAYPAYLISRLNPIDSLRNTLLKGRKGSTFRGFMIATQFSISIFMLAMVMIMYFQNERVEALSDHVPKSQIVVLEGMDAEMIEEKHETLRQEFTALADVQAVTFSSTVPFWDISRVREVTPMLGDETLGFNISMVSVDVDFMEVFDIELLAGRSFDLNISNDVFNKEIEQVNVVVNQLAAEKLGLGRGENGGMDVIGRSFYKIPDEQNSQAREYTIIGLKPDNYFFGQSTKMKPIAFLIRPEAHIYASIRVSGQNLHQTLTDIDAVWERVIENYPIRRSFLDYYFNLFFKILKGMNNVLAAFAGVALSLALIGLFGLAAFMAQRRTKEIGIRKVMGARVDQIVSMLIWQFSKPVMWSLIVAMPLAYLASSLYLDFFPERISFVVPVILLASVVGILTAWAIVASHAINIARATPIRSLRYE